MTTTTTTANIEMAINAMKAAGLNEETISELLGNSKATPKKTGKKATKKAPKTEEEKLDAQRKRIGALKMDYKRISCTWSKEWTEFISPVYGLLKELAIVDKICKSRKIATNDPEKVKARVERARIDQEINNFYMLAYDFIDDYKLNGANAIIDYAQSKGLVISEKSKKAFAQKVNELVGVQATKNSEWAVLDVKFKRQKDFDFCVKVMRMLVDLTEAKEGISKKIADKAVETIKA